MIPPPPTSTLFPYTTLFRSRGRSHTSQTAPRAGAHSARAARRAGHGRRVRGRLAARCRVRSEEHTSELQSLTNLVCRLLLEKKKKKEKQDHKNPQRQSQHRT